MESIFFEISVILLVGTLFATIAKFLKQPMIPAYILAGIVLGPALLHVIDSHDELLEALSTFGIAFLLFLVGIELDIRKFAKSGKVAIVIGVAQMAFAVGFGYLIIRVLGFESSAALFLAIALGFSSTIVVVKLLSERKELDTLFAQIIIGLMLTQDFIAVLFLIFFDVFTGTASGPDLAMQVGITIVKGGFLIGLSLLSAKYILSHVFRYFAKTSELLLLGSICWCLIFAILSNLLNFSIEVGALLAGVSLSFVPYSTEISFRIKSLRDFFLPIFFAVLGGHLAFGNGAGQFILPTIVLSALVLFASPILVSGLLLKFGYRASTSFRVGTSIGQVSEFSFIVVTMGLNAGIIEKEIVALVALIGLVTMTFSTYMIDYNEWLYAKVRDFMKRFEKPGAAHEDVDEKMKGHAVIIGHHTMGYKVRKMLETQKYEVLVIDNNPDVTDTLEKQGVPHVYGSISDGEVLEHAQIERAAFVVSTVPSLAGNTALIEYMREQNMKTRVIVTAFNIDDALDLYEVGASYVLYPTVISADFVPSVITGAVTRTRNNHIKELKQMRDLYGAV